MNEENTKQIITIQDAFNLMKVLENDIPQCEHSKIALLLLVLSANPSMAEDGDVVTDKKRRIAYEPSEELEGCWWGC